MGVRDAAAREEAREDLRPRGVDAGVHALDERRARGEREELRQEVAEPVHDRDRAIGTADADVDVEAEAVVPPDDVAQELVVAAVVRRVDDALVLPAGPRVRSRGSERQAHRLDERGELLAALGDGGGHVGEASRSGPS